MEEREKGEGEKGEGEVVEEREKGEGEVVEGEGEEREKGERDTKSKNSEISVSLALGVTDTGKNVTVIGIEDKNEKTVISCNSNSQLGKMVGLMGLLFTFSGLQSRPKIKPHIETIKMYDLLPLNFSKYTNDHVYVYVGGDETHNFKDGTYRIISKEFVNRNSILVATRYFKGMTKGGFDDEFDFDNPDMEE